MNKKWRWIWNPFEKIAGWKAFGIGIVILCLTTVLGYFSNTVFYGISIKLVQSITWGKVFSLQALGLAITVAVMYLIALLSAKRVRFQDILGTVTLAKYPLILAVLMFWVWGGRIMSITDELLMSLKEELLTSDAYKIVSEFSFYDYFVLTMFSLLSIVILVWTIALLFNAFKVSTNLKGAKSVLLFIAVILIAEIILNIVLSFLKFSF